MIYINNLLKRILLKFCRDFITLFTKRNKNRILFVQESFCGSNTFALWKLVSNEDRKKFELVLAPETGKENITIKHFVDKHKLLSSSQLIITTHASYKPSRNHINLHLWHGGSTKKSGLLEMNGKPRLKLKSLWPKVDYIMSYSETYSTFLNACMFANPNKYIITGAPRNDFLFHSDGLVNLRKIFGGKIGDNRIIFFLPTFRDYYGNKQGDRNYENLFGFNEFLSEEFDNYLSKNKLLLIFKPHPHEESLVLDYFRNYPLINLLVLKNEDLSLNNLDLYELLNASSILITDYSSVFYDYLLLDRPMVFAPVDIDSYKEKRGFLIESFENWAPGPIVFDQNSLEGEITKCLEDKNYYNEKRAWMLNLHHRFKDGESSKRLWKFINSILIK